jgi:NADH-quinone oxidoreductase subunit N
MLLQASTTELFSVTDLRLIAPELILSVFACAALVLGVILPSRLSRVVGYFALVGLLLTGISLAMLGWPYLAAPFEGGFAPAPLEGFYATLRIDGFAVVFKFIFLLSAALAVAVSFRYLDVEREQRGEFYALALFATVGMMFLASGYDLIVLYISLELMAVTFYVLVAYARREQRSNEAGLKYFLLGAFSSGVLLYGMSLLFGVAGSTNLAEIAPRVADAMLAPADASTATLRPLALLAMIALAAGLFFKVAAAPFHMWAPDAYEGAPTPVTAFLSTGSKAASFAFFARLFIEGLGGMRADWAPLLGLVAALTIFIGNWAAVTQTNAKRLLAYSSVSNAGYLLLGLVAANAYGYTGLAVYLIVYVFMNAGAFGIIISLRRRGIMGEDVESLNGLGRKSPPAALAMAVFMLSLGGLPATGGFVGKWFLFGGLIQRGAAPDGRNWYYWLAGWAALNTVVSFYYYVRFIRAMYVSEREADTQPLALSAPLKGALAVCAVAVIFIGIYPHPIIRLAEALVASLGAGTPLALR